MKLFGVKAPFFKFIQLKWYEVHDKGNWFLVWMLANPTVRSYDWIKRLNETMAVFDDIRVHRLSIGIKSDFNNALE